MPRPFLPGDLHGLLNHPQVVRGRELARSATDNAADILQPLVGIGRGLGRQAVWLRAWWARTPAENRGPLLFLLAAAAVIVVMLPYGPVLTTVAVMGSAAWAGRSRVPAPSEPQDAEHVRLRSLYEALVPCLSEPADPEPLYAHGGDWRRAFTGHLFEEGRLVRLQLRYPPYFPDSEPQARARVERLLQGKAGRGREYRFDWNEEDNTLTLVVPPALGTGIAAQRFVTGPGEVLLGFTDESAVQRTIPVTEDGQPRDAPPVMWRTGPRSGEPHLLAVGRPGSGVTTLLRSLALQGLQYGDVLVIDGGGTGEYAFLAGRPGVVAVECGLAGTLAVLEWASHETERRLIALNRARQAGRPAPEDIRRPMWIVIDRPTALSQLAQAEGRPDPAELLEVPLRHGRAAHVTVALGDHLDALDALPAAVRERTRARVALGPAGPEQAQTVLGAPPNTTPAAQLPPGRGYARLGDGPVHRLQVPATPDPYDEETSGAHRDAVLALLPGAQGAAAPMAPGAPGTPGAPVAPVSMAKSPAR